MPAADMHPTLRLFDEPERREPREDRISSRRDDDHETAREAAQDRFGKRGGHRHRILAAIVAADEQGATYEEAARAAGIGLQSAPWKRLTELEHEYAMIADSGKTRPTSTDSPARVMVATQRGKEFVALNPVSGFEFPRINPMVDVSRAFAAGHRLTLQWGPTGPYIESEYGQRWAITGLREDKTPER